MTIPAASTDGGPGPSALPPPRRLTAGSVASAARPVRSVPVRLAVMIPLLVVVLVVTQGVAAGVGTNPVVDLIVGLASAAGAVGVYACAVRRLERRPVLELDRSAVRSGLLHGAGTGLALFGTVIAVIAALGSYRVTGYGSAGACAAALGAMSAVAVDEELLFRGALFRLVEERWGTWVAVAVSAIVFGTIHLVNPGATLVGALAIAIEAGVLLAMAYAATRALWLPIGLHLAWNWAEGGLFGATVSGSAHGAQASLLTAHLHGPALLTGGSFGPEATLPAVLVCLLASIVFWRVAARRGYIRPRPQRQPLAV